MATSDASILFRTPPKYLLGSNMLENLKWISVIISSLIILSSCTSNLKGLHQSDSKKVSEMNVNNFKILDSYSQSTIKEIQPIS